MEECIKIDIIEHLLSKNQTDFCFEVFNHLDSQSFINSRKVCQSWKIFIDNEFYNTIRGEKSLREKLKSNYLNNEYSPKEEKINILEPIISDSNSNQENNNIIARIISDMKADDISICIVSVDVPNVEQAFLENYDFSSLKLLWTFKMDPDYIKSDAEDQPNLRLCVNQNRIYIFTVFSRIGGDVYIIDRKFGHCLKKFSAANTQKLIGVRDFENKVLAVVDKVELRLYNVEKTVKEITTTEIFSDNNKDHGFNFTGLQNDGNKLVSISKSNLGSGPSGEIILWKFEKNQGLGGSKVKTVQVQHNIDHMNVKWPYVVMSGDYEDKTESIFIFNLENEVLVREIKRPDGVYLDMTLQNDILFVQGFDLHFDFDEGEMTYTGGGIYLWSLKQIIDKTKSKQGEDDELEPLRVIKFEVTDYLDFFHILSNVVDCDIITNEKSSLVKRSFWP